jgi:hypothetical protein
MTCNDCDGKQVIAYYRWGTANIGIMACEKHVTEVLNVLRKHDGLKPFEEKR